VAEAGPKGSRGFALFAGLENIRGFVKTPAPATLPPEHGKAEWEVDPLLSDGVGPFEFGDVPHVKIMRSNRELASVG